MKKTREKLFRKAFDQSQNYFAQGWDIATRNPFLKKSIYWDWFEEKDCKQCRAGLIDSFGPSHNGSSMCRMRTSIASGGNRSHCTCRACF